MKKKNQKKMTFYEWIKDTLGIEKHNYDRIDAVNKEKLYKRWEATQK